MARVYVSSTRSDLHDYRIAVNATLRRLGHEDVAMDYYTAEGRPPIEKCLEDVASCDLYIGMVAWQYGSVPLGYDRSFTELELRKAQEAGIEPLFFVLSDKTPWPPPLIDADRSRVEALRQYVNDNLLRSEFSDVNELRAAVGEAVQGWAQRRGIQTDGERTDWDGYRRAVSATHEYVQLSVIAGAKQDRVAQIPLTEVFVAPMVAAGTPSYDLPDEVLEGKRELIGLDGTPDDDTVQQAGEVSGDGQGGLEVTRTERILDVLCRERLQVFLGGPGSGKSTLLHYALLVLCSPNSAGEPALPRLGAEPPIPFLIELRQYSLDRATDFLSYLVSNTQSKYGVEIERDELKTLLGANQRAVVFFDGLDEILGAEERARVIEQFISFARSFPNTSIVVTSRIVGYDNRDAGVAGFEHYTLLDFELPEIREFVPRWYRFYTWQGDIRDAPGLLQRISESPRLLELAGNPLLLTMMAVIYKHQDLPEQRWQLYERCTSVLLEDWELKRKRIDSTVLLPVNLPIRHAQKSEILQQVSMYILEHGQVGKELNAISHKPLMKILADYLEQKYDRSRGEAEAIAEGVLQNLRERSSILAEIGEGIFGFVHRTFMEYFAALSCLAEFNAREADYSWMTLEVFGAHWEEDHWREVLLLLVAMLADQMSPVKKVVEHLWTKCPRQPPHNVVFAARCLAEAGKVEDPEWSKALMDELVRAISKEINRTKQRDWPSGKDETALLVNEGLTTFAALCPLVEVPEAARLTIDKLNRSTTRRVRIAGWQMELALRSREERLDFALAALRDREEAVRRGAVAALGREWPRNARVGEALVGVVLWERNTRVCQDALEVLRRSWPRRSDVLAAIAARLPGEQAYSFVAWLIEYVSTGWAPDVQALELVLSLAGTRRKVPVNYNYDEVLTIAVHGIAGNWRGDAVAAQMLRDRIADTDNVLRQVALLALGGGWPGPDTFQLLRTALLEAPDLPTRLAAACAIARLDHDDESLRLFRTLAVDRDAGLSLRQVAILALGEAGPDHEASRHALRELLAADPTSKIRLTALSALTDVTQPTGIDVKGFHGGRLVPGLHHVREMLSTATPDAFAVLRTCATEDEDPQVREAAVVGLFRTGTEEALGIIRDRFRDEPEPRIRRAILKLSLFPWTGMYGLDVFDIDQTLLGFPWIFSSRWMGSWEGVEEILEMASRDPDAGVRRLVHRFKTAESNPPWMIDVDAPGQPAEDLPGS